MIEVINSSDVFVGSSKILDITETELTENNKNKEKFFDLYINNYNLLFNFFYSKLIRHKYTEDILEKKHDIKIF